MHDRFVATLPEVHQYPPKVPLGDLQFQLRLPLRDLLVPRFP
jgi:hypothetical protein